MVVDEIVELLSSVVHHHMHERRRVEHVVDLARESGDVMRATRGRARDGGVETAVKQISVRLDSRYGLAPHATPLKLGLLTQIPVTASPESLF